MHENEYKVEQGARVTYCEVEQAVELQKSKGIVSRESGYSTQLAGKIEQIDCRLTSKIKQIDR